MRRGARGWMAAVAAGLALAGPGPGAGPAGAVEYRLQVVSLFEHGIVAFASPRELEDGAAGPGLDRLEATLDRGAVSPGALLWDRRVQPASLDAARAWGAAPVEATLVPASEAGRNWDTLTWQGEPGARSVWVLSPTGRYTRELHRLALRGTGPMRQHQPYALPRDARPVAALRLPLNFVWFHEERGSIWRHVAPWLDLGAGLGVVVGATDPSPTPDSVYVVVQHAPGPTTYKAVLSWRQRPEEHERPSLHERTR